MKSELISELLLSLISEKRAQYRNDTLKLLINIEEDAYGKFAVVSASTFNRILSNLINNSKEAGSDRIQVILSMLGVGKQSNLLLRIQDNGSGIQPQTLDKIISGERFSTKENGNGLGLPHAIKTVEREWGGKLNIRLAEENTGTIIEILLPEAATPKWFLDQLTVSRRNTIVILDEDESIHQVWNKRFDDIHGIKFVNYYNPRDLLSLDNFSSINLFLIDYEFVGCNESGLDLIEKLNIANRSYLVTSRHEDHHIRKRCEKIGLKIIPKAFAVYIPIILLEITKKSADLIFIDDDSVITDAWTLQGLTKGKVIATYNSIRSFKIDINCYDLSTPIYIDSNLNDLIEGQEYAKELYEKGFEHIYLATGHLPDKFQRMYWIKDIISKSPPF